MEKRVRKHQFRVLLGLLVMVLAPQAVAETGVGISAGEQVVLLHGLARSADSMAVMQRALEGAGYQVCNLDYPSRHHGIEALVSEHVLPGLDQCGLDLSRPVHFVTHSLGGVLVRQLTALAPDFPVGRVVMLGPPNGGSEVVDRLGDWRAFRWLNGPAGSQLGTDAHSVPRSLGPTTLEVGIIAGTRSVNPILSRLLPGQDDGKVTVANARLEGMRDFLVLPVTHTFMMQNRDVIRQTCAFLAEGAFLRVSEDARAS